eukprot:15460526-Alexandrium_andersonii.AAC.1
MIRARRHTRAARAYTSAQNSAPASNQAPALSHVCSRCTSARAVHPLAVGPPRLPGRPAHRACALESGI